MDKELTAFETWFSPLWFYPEQLLAFNWARPYLLYAVLLVPILFIFRWVLFVRHRQRLPFAFGAKEFPHTGTEWLRFVPGALLSASLAMLIICLARPQKTNELAEQSAEGIDIMLAIDISESMKIEDFKPNRLEAAKTVAHAFVEGRFQDRIGLVVFAGEAFSLCPLTTDYVLLNRMIDEIDFSMITKPSTAIGSALAVATNRLRESEAKSKVVILLSDGENTGGNIDPSVSAGLAKAYGLKIYTIGVGQDGRVPFGKDPFGNTMYVENAMDESTLRQLAEVGDGRYFRASNNQALVEVFKQIDEFEKVEIKETRFKFVQDFYPIYLLWAITFFLLWMLTKVTFMANVLED